MSDQKNPKKTFAQLLADTKSSLYKIGQKILPRLGYLYILLLVCAVAYVISTVNQTFDLSSSSNTTSTTPSPDTSSTNFTFSFDAATVAKVKALSSGQANMTVTLPSGRINPFSE